jgi:hypothetical protein
VPTTAQANARPHGRGAAADLVKHDEAARGVQDHGRLGHLTMNVERQLSDAPMRVKMRS